MNMQKVILFFLLSITLNLFSQEEIEQINEVIITSTRLDIPFSKTAKKITILTAEDIKKATATNLTDLLQHIEGIDVVRRGINGMQSDIKIRGGNFQQTLLLIDGFKTEDVQTGHHTMNMLLPLENIERIEIVKGASARIFGQNAFSGAINIVTKKITKDKLDLASSYGANKYQRGAIITSKQFKKISFFANYSQQRSDGYRSNTDFINNNYFLKTSLKTAKEPIHLLATFADRKFGAQNFYTSPASNFKEYEETQSSLVGISTKYHFSKLTLKPKVYWKRNQDMFLLKRDDPEFSRNHNISNKVGVELNTSYKSNVGTTGFGVDVAKVSLASNNLGNQDRTMLTMFVEHRYVTKNGKLDFTPGIAISYFSDFKLQTFPGLDVGYKVNQKTRLYWNVGSSYRVPTYTEMYINIPNFLSGNENLKPEKAVTQDFGIKYNTKKLNLSTAVFYRISNDLIDYVKKTSASPFYKAKNLRTIRTKGFELSANYTMKIKYDQSLQVGYTYLKDDNEAVDVFKSRYLLNNTIKHHFTSSLQTQFFKYVKQSISYRFVDKPLNSYAVLDARVSASYNHIELSILANNILDTEYFEKEFIPMPKSNFEVGLKYGF